MNLINQLNTIASSPYCEKTLNVITSFAFFTSAYFSYRLLVKNKLNKLSLNILPILITLIGIGSSAFHLFPNIRTSTMDVGSIILFAAFAIFLLIQKLTKNIKLSIAVIAFYSLLLVSISLVPVWWAALIRNSLILSSVVLIYFYFKQKSNNIASQLLLISLVYGLAIFVSYLDHKVCRYFPFGTHFIWHLLTAILTYSTVKLEIDINSR